VRWYQDGGEGYILYYFVPETRPHMRHPGIFFSGEQMPDWLAIDGAAGEHWCTKTAYYKGNDPIGHVGGVVGTDADFSGHGIPPADPTDYREFPCPVLGVFALGGFALGATVQLPLNVYGQGGLLLGGEIVSPANAFGQGGAAAAGDAVFDNVYGQGGLLLGGEIVSPANAVGQGGAAAAGDAVFDNVYGQGGLLLGGDADIEVV
jgi:hypothetical protein